ncbi:MAG: hypothetical protein HQL15_09145 [Candidatus Omnitrophica bacterium]|nr:hypothetical protein [Candidatus Omnitrophota bacterium]
MRIFLTILFLFLFCNLAIAETIKLKTGVAVQGNIVELTDDHVVLDKGKNNFFRYRFDQIDDESLAILKNLPKVLRQQESVDNSIRNAVPQEIRSESLKEAQTNRTVNSNDNRSHTEYLECQKNFLAQVNNNNEEEGFNVVKTCLEKPIFQNEDLQDLMLERIGVVGSLIGKGMQDFYYNDQAHYFRVAQEEIDFIHQYKGLSKFRETVAEAIKLYPNHKMEEMDQMLEVPYFVLSVRSASQGRFDEADSLLGEISPIFPQYVNAIKETMIDPLKDFYSTNQDLIPLYSVLLENGHPPLTAIIIAKRLSELNKSFDFGGIIQGDGLINKLTFYKKLLKDDTKNNSQDNHLAIYIKILGEGSLDDFKKVSSNQSDDFLRKVALFQKCTYYTYLGEVLLKSKGIKSKALYTPYFNTFFATESWWDKALILMGLKPSLRGDTPHVCNIVDVDNDHFVIADFLNKYISPKYSWSKDVSHIGNWYRFTRDDVFIKKFRVLTPNNLRAQQYAVFSDVFQGDLQREYLSRAIFLDPSDPDYYLSMAKSFDSQGMSQDYDRWMQKASDADPLHPPIKVDRAVHKFTKGEYQEAKSLIDDAMTADPLDNPQCAYGAYLTAALMYSADSHDRSKAKEYQQKAIDIAKKYDFEEKDIKAAIAIIQ